MSFSADTGCRGESAVAEHLCNAGYCLCERNWRSGPYELDIVAVRDDVLHIVEVKTRRAGSLTPPEAAITRHKQRSLRRAAVRYMALRHWQGEVQFDVACVTIHPDHRTEVELIEQGVEYNW